MTTQQSDFFSSFLPELFNDWEESVSYSSEISYQASKDSTIYWSASDGRLVNWF